MSDSRFAVVFPGQGSQKVAMLSGLAQKNKVINETFEEASDALGYDLWELCQNGPQEAMNLTEKTQPLLLTSSVAIWRIWESRVGQLPMYMAGHSLGEFSALVCSGALDFQSTVSLVRLRGQFMQSAVPVGVGAMAAIIGLDDAAIVTICDELVGQKGATKNAQVVQAVNFNSPGQVVIAGHLEAVEKAIEACKSAGAKRAMPLPVSAPFHTSLMESAGEALAEAMSSLQFNVPKIPIVHNVHAALEQDPEKIKALMVRQISSPVKWSECIQYMVENGVESTVECGPGKVLSGLGRRIHKPLQVFSTDEQDAIDKAIESLV